MKILSILQKSVLKSCSGSSITLGYFLSLFIILTVPLLVGKIHVSILLQWHLHNFPQ